MAAEIRAAFRSARKAPATRRSRVRIWDSGTDRDMSRSSDNTELHDDVHAVARVALSARPHRRMAASAHRGSLRRSEYVFYRSAGKRLPDELQHKF